MKLNNLNLNMLKCFQAVAEKGSLQNGAKALNLTASAVYQSIKKLEDELDQHLFFRTGNSYILTDTGRNLQELYQRFMWDFSQFQDGTKNAATRLEGTIRVGVPLNFSKSMFVPLMKKFLVEHPDVNFQVTIAETRRLAELVCGFELDFAITDDAIPTNFAPKLVTEVVFREELVLACSKSFQRKFEKELANLKTMKELPHLDYAKNFPLIQRWYKLHYKRQVQVNDGHVIDNVETMVTALKEGLGLAVVPRGLIGDLHAVASKEKELSNPLLLVQEANYINNPLLKRFLQFMKVSI